MDGIGDNKNEKREVASSRVSHDLRNMRLAGSERTLAQVIGNLIAGRLGPHAQTKVFDILFSEVPQKAKRTELLDAIVQAGLSYNPEQGAARERGRDESHDRYANPGREDESRMSLPSSA